MSDIISYTERDVNVFLIQVQKALVTSASISFATVTRVLLLRLLFTLKLWIQIYLLHI